MKSITLTICIVISVICAKDAVQALVEAFGVKLSNPAAYFLTLIVCVITNVLTGIYLELNEITESLKEKKP